jgi:hypothetical protein
MLALVFLLLGLLGSPDFGDEYLPTAPDAGGDVVAMDDGGPIPPKP